MSEREPRSSFYAVESDSTCRSYIFESLLRAHFLWMSIVRLIIGVILGHDSEIEADGRAL